LSSPGPFDTINRYVPATTPAGRSTTTWVLLLETVWSSVRPRYTAGVRHGREKFSPVIVIWCVVLSATACMISTPSPAKLLFCV
jgi:hypothetical protein